MYRIYEQTALSGIWHVICQKIESVSTSTTQHHTISHDPDRFMGTGWSVSSRCLFLEACSDITITVLGLGLRLELLFCLQAANVCSLLAISESTICDLLLLLSMDVL